MLNSLKKFWSPILIVGGMLVSVFFGVGSVRAVAPSSPSYMVPGPTVSTPTASTFDVKLQYVESQLGLVSAWQAVFTPSSGPVVTADCDGTSIQYARTSDNAVTTPATAWCRVSGLVPSTTYTVKSRGKNSANEWSGYSMDQVAGFTTPAPPTPPAAPAITNAVSALGGAKLTVTTPSSNGGSVITGYKWRATADSGVNYISGVCSGTPLPSITVNLTNQTCNANSSSIVSGTSYEYSIAATNVVGDSSYSAVSAAVIAKGNVVAGTMTPSSNSVTVTFTPPADAVASGIDGYSCLASVQGQAPISVVATSSPCVLTGLTSGASYTILIVPRISGTPQMGASVVAGQVTTTVATTTVAPSVTTTTTPTNSIASWDVEPASDGDAAVEATLLYPTSSGVVYADAENGFGIDAKGRVTPRTRMKNLMGTIKLTMTSSYKSGSKTVKYSCKFPAYGSTKKQKTIKWRTYIGKPCTLPKPLIASVKAGNSVLSITGNYPRVYVTTGKKVTPEGLKIKNRMVKVKIGGARVNP